MSESSQDHTLVVQLQRMQRMRIPLLFLLSFNGFLVLAVPLSGSNQDDKPVKTAASTTQEDMAATTTQVNAAATTTQNPPLAPQAEDTDDPQPSAAAVADATPPAPVEVENDPDAAMPVDKDAVLAEILGETQDPSQGEIVEAREPNEFVEHAKIALGEMFRQVIRADLTTARATQDSSSEQFSDGRSMMPAVALAEFAKSIGKLVKQGKPLDATTTAEVDEGIVLFNPVQTGGEVHYLVDGVVYTLLPGESQSLAGGPKWRIQFHRGDDFDNVEYFVANGHFMFHVSDNGWELSEEE